MVNEKISTDNQSPSKDNQSSPMDNQSPSKDSQSPSRNRFITGFAFSTATFFAAAFLFFWFAVLRRANVLNAPVAFDSDVAMAVIIVPIMVAIPWLPLSLISGFLTRKMDFQKALRIIVSATLVVCVALGIVFWKLPYN